MTPFNTSTRLMDFVLPTKSGVQGRIVWLNIMYCFKGDYFNFQTLALLIHAFLKFQISLLICISLACFKEV